MPKSRATYFQRIARAPMAATPLDAPWAVRMPAVRTPDAAPLAANPDAEKPLQATAPSSPPVLVPGAAVGHRESATELAGPAEPQALEEPSAFSVTSLNQKQVQPGTPMAINLQASAPASQDAIQPARPNQSGPGQSRQVSLTRAEFSHIPPINISNPVNISKNDGTGRQAAPEPAPVEQSSPASALVMPEEENLVMP